MTKLIDRVRDSSEFLIASLIALFALLVLNADRLQEPPVWDTAAGVFAPAIFLFENQANFSELLDLEGYAEAGPNTHTLSTVTLLTYAVIWISGGNPDVFLPVLHLLHILMTALIVGLTYSLGRMEWSTLGASMPAVIILFTPFFLVQSSYMYLEIPGALMVLLSTRAWVLQKGMQAVAFALLAMSIKSFGLVVVATLLVLQFWSMRGNPKKYSLQTFVLLAGTALIELPRRFTSNPSSRPIEWSLGQQFVQIERTLATVPELFLLVLVCLLLAVFVPILGLLRWRLNSEWTPNTAAVLSYSGRLRLFCFLAVCSFLSFIFLVPVTGNNLFPLVRYYVWIYPLLLLLAAYVFASIREPLQTIERSYLRWLSVGALNMVVVGGIVFLALNRHGGLYKDQDLGGLGFSRLERSFEYQQYLEMDLAALKTIGAEYSDWPVFATRGDFYYLSSPLMGYIRNEIDDLHFVKRAVENQIAETSLPARFVILDTSESAFHGAAHARGLLRYVNAVGSYEVSALEINDGPLPSVINEVRLVSP